MKELLIEFGAFLHTTVGRALTPPTVECDICGKQMQEWRTLFLCDPCKQLSSEELVALIKPRELLEGEGK